MTFTPEAYVGTVLGSEVGLLEVIAHIGEQKGREMFVLRCLNDWCGRTFPKSGHAIMHHRAVGKNGGRSTNVCAPCRARQRDEASGRACA